MTDTKGDMSEEEIDTAIDDAIMLERKRLARLLRATAATLDSPAAAAFRVLADLIERDN